MFKACANLEEAEQAQASGLLWLNYGGDWWPENQSRGYVPVRAFYHCKEWHREDFAILIEDE